MVPFQGSNHSEVCDPSKIFFACYHTEAKSVQGHSNSDPSAFALGLQAPGIANIYGIDHFHPASLLVKHSARCPGLLKGRVLPNARIFFSRYAYARMTHGSPLAWFSCPMVQTGLHCGKPGVISVLREASRGPERVQH